MQWVTFAPISKYIVAHYKKTSFQIDLFSLLFMIIYPIVNFPCSYITDKISIRLGVK